MHLELFCRYEWARVGRWQGLIRMEKRKSVENGIDEVNKYYFYSPHLSTLRQKILFTQGSNLFIWVGAYNMLKAQQNLEFMIKQTLSTGSRIFLKKSILNGYQKIK